MRSFHGKQKIKDKYLDRVKKHRELDNIIQGIGWENGKGCAVGCTLENYDHSMYPIELGIPEWLARLEDVIFEKLPNDEAKLWPEKFLDAISVGVNLENIKHKLAIIRLNNLLEIQNKLLESYKNTELEKIFIDVINSIEMVKKFHESGLNKLNCDLSAAWSVAESARSVAESARSAAESARSAAESARSAAESAAGSARSAARSAAWSAAESAARSAAESAAWSAAWSAAESARSAAWSAAWLAAESAAWSAAESVSESAWSAEGSAAWSAAWSAAESARSAAWSAAWEKEADTLIELLKQCK